MSKIGRNDPCHCGSGKKYKKCCLSKDEELILEKIREAALINEGEPWEEEEEDTGWITLDDEHEGLEEEEAGDDEEENEDDNDNREAEGDDMSFNKEDGKDEDISGKDNPYPAISKEEDAIVNEWWEVYKKMEDNPDKIHRHLQEFMDNHSPEMVENLGMEHEILFELGACYYRADRHEEYIQLLKDIRLKYPDVYKRSAGFYDEDIITWLIANKQHDEICNYLAYFEKYPVDYADKMFKVTNLLQATDIIPPLLSLVKKVHQKVTTSPKVINGQAIIFPLVTHIMSGYLRPDFTEAELEQMLKELTEEFNDEFEGIDFWDTRFDQIFRPFTLWEEGIPPKKSEMEEKYRAISFNYTRYLHEYKNISWVSAHYYSQLMLKYLFEYMDLNKNKPKNLFNFKKEIIDKIVGKLAGGFIFPDIVQAMAILNTTWYFQEYLYLCGNVAEPQKKIIQADCTCLYNEIYKPWRKENIEALCFPKFPFWE